MEEYNKCETIVTNIVNTASQEYGRQFLEGASTSTDSTFTDLGNGFQAMVELKGEYKPR